MAKSDFTTTVISLLVFVFSLGSLFLYWSINLFSNDWKFFGFLCGIISFFCFLIFFVIIYEEATKKSPKTSFETVVINDFLREYSNVLSKEIKDKIQIEKSKGEKTYKINSFILDNIKSKQLNYTIKSSSSLRKVSNPNIDPRNKYSMLNDEYKPKSKQDAIARIEYLKVEQRELQSTLNRHTQIIQESLNIMHTTKNLDAIKSRFDTIYENHTYIKMYQDKGYSVNFDQDFISKLVIEYNKIIINLAKFKVDEFEIKFNSLKTEKVKDNNTKKIYLFLDEIKHSFKRPTKEYHKEIQILNNKIEDIYS